MHDLREFLISFFIVLALLLINGCSTPASKLFTKRTPHESYLHQLQEAGLLTTELGKRWTDAARLSLLQPVTMTIPFQERGYFAGEDPAAYAYSFNAKRGQKIRVQITATPKTTMLLFADIYQQTTGANPAFLISLTDSLPLEYEAKSDGNYLLRIQPELLQSGGYHLIVTSGPSIDFPVVPGAGARVGSFFGNRRDGGSRSHEGIDIFAKYRTPVVAPSPGYITNVSENNLGGKVVFMRATRKNYTFYFAHLDSQMVSAGQEVKTGDTLGLMGNTGNARTTPPHLHFGIYTTGAAVDPLPFVAQEEEQPARVIADTNLLHAFAYNARPLNVYFSPSIKAKTQQKLPPRTPVLIVAATDNWYKIKMPDQQVGFTRIENLTAGKPIQTFVTTKMFVLYDSPSETAKPKKQVSNGSELQILGTYQQHTLVRTGGITGWQLNAGGLKVP
ncbi:MAG: peptidoglycan DD-metalloendopeptidase family protein [Bacteroidota bacterium]